VLLSITLVTVPAPEMVWTLPSLVEANNLPLLNQIPVQLPAGGVAKAHPPTAPVVVSVL